MDDCEAAAKDLGLGDTSVETGRWDGRHADYPFPPGCFQLTWGELGYNTNSNSIATCQHELVDCICKKKGNVEHQQCN